MPEITVLMTVYNGMPFLPMALESMLNQTWADFEFLIINDASTDHSREVILKYRDPRIRLIDNDVNLHQTRSLNRGLQETRTDFVARMDADDVSHPERLEKQIAFLRRRPEVAVVGTNNRWIDSSGNVTGTWVRPRRDLGLRWAHLSSCQISGGSVMFQRRVIWDELRGFDPAFRFSQDWELWSRVHHHHYEAANLPELLLDVRTHPNAGSLKHESEVRLEDSQIRKLYRQRIFGDGDDAGAWLAEIEALIERRNEPPSRRAELITAMFERFCSLYPAAREDPEVLAQLSQRVAAPAR